MVIGDLYIMGIAISPREANAELIIDPNAVLPFPIVVQLFQSVAGRNSQILQVNRRIERGKFPLGYISQTRRGHPLALTGVPERFRVLVGEALNHLQSLTCHVNNVKR
jgi:hypothetical protein